MPGPGEQAFTVNLRVHESRTGSLAGARDEFEQMIGQLVDAFHPGARRIGPNPGDGGIDVYVGDLDGRIVVWQAKYFVPTVTSARRQQIRESFTSALKNARKFGYQIDRWVLCVPSSMDLPTSQWWDRWKNAQLTTTTEQTKVETKVELWDETRLLTLLSRPEAAYVRSLYYGPHSAGPPDWHNRATSPGRQPAPPSAPAVITAPSARFGRALRGGELVRIAGRTCLLHGGLDEHRGTDGSWVARQGAVSLVGPPARPAWLRQIMFRQPRRARQPGYEGDEATALAAAVEGQVRLLSDLGGRRGIPRLVASEVNAAEAVVLSARPPGRTWREVFGPATPNRSRALDRTTATALLLAAARLGDCLAALHEAGHSHRALTADGVLLVDEARTSPALRDVGLAAFPLRAGEGPEQCRAPEQERLGVRAADDPAAGVRTDVYRLAALTYHCATGRPPVPGTPVQLRGFGFGFGFGTGTGTGTGTSTGTGTGARPDSSSSDGAWDDVLYLALDPDPARRPARMPVLADALRAGAEHLARTVT